MNLIGYANRFKDKTFFEKPFSNVDAAILCALAYANFEKICPSYENPKDVLYFQDLSEKQINEILKGTVFEKEDGDLLRILCHSYRYQRVGVSFAMSILTHNITEQFCAFAFVVPSIGYFIAFRGTDRTVQGWKENFLSSVHEITPSQLDAIDYLYHFNKVHKGETFMVGGHSKGGNLAMYSALFSSGQIPQLITKCYSFDGNGFASERFSRRETYKDILPKIIQIAPKQSLVSELFYTPKNKKYIKSKGVSLLQHNLFYWKINNNGVFVRAKKPSKFTAVHRKMTVDFIASCNEKEKRMIIDVIVDGFSDENGTAYFTSPVGKHPIRKIKRNVRKNYSKEDRKKLKKLYNLGIRNYLKSFFHVFFRKH